jgi:mono/diheme cytochrome c family protein
MRTVFALALAAWSPALATAAGVSFNRDIRPILSENCFACHGFDAKQRKADLRLDIAEGAFADRDGNFAIKPGDLAKSEVWRRILSEDPEEVMPPPKTKRTLTAEQKETVRRWIEQGAPYQKHWAFEAPVKVAEPAVKNGSWARTPVDRFLLARLERDGLTPRPEADKQTLIRRVAFALTGLPPTLSEVAAFEADQSPQAYENMVDRYLGSPRYGEEMARHWLDVARYADTHGLHLDNERTMWAYRDWVIGAFNANKPFDAFTVEQLAGDLLPNPTREQLVATGFNRCNVTTSEGGSIESEFLYRYAVDRASTMVQAWMGLTGGCAVCHDHKYDPLSTKEFYSLYAFFYSAADPAMDRNTNTTDPFFKLAADDQKAALAQAQTHENEAKQLLEEAAGRVEYRDPADQTPAPERRFVEDVWLDDAFPFGAKVTCSSRNASIWVTAPDVEPQLGRRALEQASASNYQDKFENPTQPLLISENAKLSVWVRLDPHEPSKALLVELVAGSGNRKAIWGDPKHFGGAKTDKTWLGDTPEPGRWTRLEIPADKLDLKPGELVRSVALAQFGGIAWWDGLVVAGEVTPASDPRSSFSAWWKERTGKETPGLPAELVPVLKDGPEKNPAAELREKLLRFYLAFVARPLDVELQGRQQAWLEAQAARAALDDSIPGTFIFKELDKPREAFVMLRGQYDKPGEKVEPSVPAIFPTLKKPQPEARATRLDLANWLLAPEHPLTARVAVNRLWQQFFGTGLVKTSYDFGSQGESPSHPELLDWLAISYRENGWDTKALVRLLVTSAAFRQDSRVSPELLRLDPANRLYARAPRFRLDAEQVRDNALFVSGLMNLAMGGRGVKGYQPPNIWEPVGYSDSNTRFYLQDHGPALYRRSIYAFLKRTAPPPFMSNFDAPNREQFCTLRERSNTPLQALQLMNDTQHFEAARALGERILSEGGASPEARIAFAYRVVLSREPRPEELAVVKPALDLYVVRYRDDVAAARRVVAVGESKPKAGLAESELAAYTLLANLVLNLDETVMRN